MPRRHTGPLDVADSPGASAQALERARSHLSEARRECRDRVREHFLSQEDLRSAHGAVDQAFYIACEASAQAAALGAKASMSVWADAVATLEELASRRAVAS